MKNKLPPIATLVFGVCLTMSAAWAAPASRVTMVTPDEIKWADLPLIPGAKLAVLEGQMDKKGPITARIKLPANGKVAAHWHPGVERVTVLSGTFNYGMGDKLDPEKTSPFGPGSLIVMPPQMHHFGWTKEETVIQINVEGPWGITYVNPADDPRKK
jgi:anti-sigma factor ChrR (cupin superfamily)